MGLVLILTSVSTLAAGVAIWADVSLSHAIIIYYGSAGLAGILLQIASFLQRRRRR